MGDGFQVVNVRLLSHPFNWVIVWITLALAAIAYGVIHDAVVSPKTEDLNAIS